VGAVFNRDLLGRTDTYNCFIWGFRIAIPWHL